MKKSRLFFIATVALVSGGLFASCGGNKKAENTESLEEKAVEESFTPGDKTEAVDSLQVIDEMVQAVDSSVKGINGTKYNATFFNDEANKGEKATSDKYAQTASGLKYVIASEGSGKSPKATDTVTVHYVGTLTDGTQFDSSIDRGEPIDFPLNGVIPGWTEGLQLMKEGGTAVFYIPSNLAYGERGVQNPYTGEYSIPPSAPLIFWVQLLQVN